MEEHNSNYLGTTLAQRTRKTCPTSEKSTINPTAELPLPCFIIYIICDLIKSCMQDPRNATPSALPYSPNNPTWMRKEQVTLLLIYKHLTSSIQLAEQITLFSSRTE